MILRFPDSPVSPVEESLPVWEVVERTQRQPCAKCWMITQPSHAALAGELAAHLNAPQFPVTDQQLIRAIALHDAGWGMPDAQAIMKSRSHNEAPESFLAKTVPQFLDAWKKSIETCEPVAAAGGYMVSRHFWRLAEHRAGLEGKKPDRQKLESFLKREEQRQKSLAARQPLNVQQLEDLTDLLQFCDLLSLYLCCGAGQRVVFPEYFGVQLRAAKHSESYTFDPPLIQSGAVFHVAALGFPATGERSSQAIEIRIG